MIGPTIGGWLYEIGGIRAAVPRRRGAGRCRRRRRSSGSRCPPRARGTEPVPIRRRAAVAGGRGLRGRGRRDLGDDLDARAGAAAVPDGEARRRPGAHRPGLRRRRGRLDRSCIRSTAGWPIAWGGRRLMMIGLVAGGVRAAAARPDVELPVGDRVLSCSTPSAVALVITPSLAYMAEATSSAGVGSFGVGYGLYNMAWGAGLLGGPALGGFLFERIGFRAADAGVGAAAAGRHACCWQEYRSSRLRSPLEEPAMRPCSHASPRLTARPALVAVLAIRFAPTSAPTRKRASSSPACSAACSTCSAARRRAKASTSTVAVKGDRKATINDTTGQIIDLAEEKVYDLDLKKKSYKVTTFAELRRRMEEAKKKAEEDARKEAAREKDKPRRRRSEREAGGDRLRHQEHRREEDDQRLRHARGRHDDHRAREGQDARAGRRHGHDLRHVAGAEDRRR